MDFLGQIITPVVQSLMVPVKKHLGFLFSYTNHVTKMRARLSELNGRAKDVREEEKACMENNLVVPTNVPGWLTEVEKINEDAGNILRGGNGCFSMKVKYKAGKGSFNIIKMIDDLENVESKIKWTKERIPLGMVTGSTMPTKSGPVHDDDDDGTQNMFRSRQSIFKDVIKSLKPDCKTSMMALCGLGGVGKTTMMEEVKTVVKKRGMFKWVLMVVVGEKSDPIAIQEGISQYMRGPLIEKTRDARAESLGKRFVSMSENGKNKILIIMDDVWEMVELKDIGLQSPLPDGFKLLVTSRDEKVCMKMGIESSSIFRLVGLDKVEARILFKESARLPDGDDERESIGESILHMCGGLPMAIKTMALALKDEPKEVWADAFERLRHHDLEDLYGTMNRIFDMSYNKLRNEDKSIFILCGLFPDDFNIPMEDLMRYGWGLQFFAKVNSLIKARDQTKRCIVNLIHANLLTGSDERGCVRMHDLARAFVLGNFLKFKQASIVNHGDESEWPTQDIMESCERILLKCEGIEFPEDFSYPSLSLLKLMNKEKVLKFPEDFYKRMKNIEVLSYDKMIYPLLPVSFQFSTNLRTLCLHSCSLRDIDIYFVGDLINLEILSFAHCGIQKLPSAIGKLEKLKLLDLTGCANLCLDNGVFEKLNKLEELYMRVSKKKGIRFTDANREQLAMLSRKLYALEVEFYDILPQNMSFGNLLRFRISVGCYLDEIGDEIIDKYFFKNTLMLEATCSELMECKINELFSQTKMLYLRVKDMTHVGEIMKHPSQCSTFNNLTVLKIFGCQDLTHMFTVAVANGLKKLETLSIASCPSLVSFCEGDIDVIELPELVELNLCNLPNFTSIFPENNVSAKHPFLIKEVLVPNLSKLIVDSMENLKQIWPCDVLTGGEEDNFPTLREIKVNDCRSLVNLFPVNPMQVLSQLNELTVSKCCSIKVIFNIDLGKTEKLISTFKSNLTRIQVENLDELREVWRVVNDGNNSGQCIHGFQAVKRLDIRSCRKFRNVCTPTTANFDFEALPMGILISDCGENIERIDGKEDVGFTSTQLMHTFHHLRSISTCRWESTVRLFEIECPNNNTKSEITTQQQQQPPLLLLPYLEDLSLVDMRKLQYVWNCNNWNDFFSLQPQAEASFHNLRNIKLWQCGKIKYLFSPRMSRLLSNLKTINMVTCQQMYAIVSDQHDGDHHYKDEEIMTASTTTLFPHFDTLYLTGLNSLGHIGGHVAKRTTNHDQFTVSAVSWSLCQFCNSISLNGCNALSSVIPAYVAGQMQKLQQLRISDCDSMVEAFETNESLPFSLPMAHHQFPNLKILEIISCPNLKYIFTFSTLESLRKLEKLEIRVCKALQIIVSEENEGTSSSSSSSSKVVVEFPRLKSIVLVFLPNLAGFFLGKNTEFHFPALDYVMIEDCPQMKVFTSGESTARKLNCIRTGLGKYNLESCGLNFHHQSPSRSDSTEVSPPWASWSFHNLVELDLNLKFGVKKAVPSTELLKLQNLGKIHLRWREDLEEVFEVAPGITNSESQTTTVVRFPKLREVELTYLRSLKYMWKSCCCNQRRILLEFPNLTRLAITECHALEYVFTPSMVSALMQLQELVISNLFMLEVIIKEEKESCDGKVGGEIIMFPCLKSLKLKQIYRLKGFYLGGKEENLISFPSLNKLVIKDCSQISIFTKGRSITPVLKLLKTNFGLFGPVQDVNSFIITKKEEGFSFKENKPF